jgi:hypothetical protein
MEWVSFAATKKNDYRQQNFEKKVLYIKTDVVFYT